MRSLQITVLAAILLTGCTLCDASVPARESRPEGGNFTAGVITLQDEVEKCYLDTPSHEIIEFKPNDTSGDKYTFIPVDIIKCQVLIKDLNQNDNGIWTIHFESTSGSKRTQSYDITVFVPTTTTEPTIRISSTTESDESVEYLPAENINTTLGTNHTIIIRDYFPFLISDRCILETPDGQRIDFKNLNKPDIVEVISHPDAGCAVNMIVKSEDVVGDWTLISEGTRFSAVTERRLPFTIRVEEKVEASVDEVTLADGNDFYIRLKNSIPNFDTCRLVGPSGSREFENDERFSAKCGFIVKEVTTADSGTWLIQYGNNILHTARVVLNVNGNSSGELPSLTWHRGDDINTTLGPEYAVYCRLENPSGRVVFDGFGRCRVVVDRVTMEHDGDWKMNIGVPGGVLTENYKIVIRVVERAHETPVMTSVIDNKPVVTITCKTTSRFPLRSCKFRNSHGSILLATEGVGQGRFTFHGEGSRYNNGVYSHECGFQITNPTVQDQGFWRCALETEDSIHYGFLKVMSPWLMRDPEIVASIVREPSLSSSEAVSAAGASSSLRCSAPASLRYCYFRDTNGTVFNVVPTSPNYEGGGFPSGECGIRFSSLEVTDSGAWSCHVGIDKGGSIVELRSFIEVSVYDLMVVTTNVLPGALLVSAHVHNHHPLEYCRFVRSDGLGFASVADFPRYIDKSVLANGECTLWVQEPSLVERRPWTVVARLIGGDEIARTASNTLILPRPVEIRYFGFSGIWVFIITTGILLVIVSSIVAPKRNRRWAQERASALRNSFMRKPPPSSDMKNTACAA